MLQAKEHPLFEPGLGYDVRNLFVALKQGITLAEGKPQHVGSSELTLAPTLHDTVKEVVLGLSALDEVSPPTEVVALGVLGTTHHQAL